MTYKTFLAIIILAILCCSGCTKNENPVTVIPTVRVTWMKKFNGVKFATAESIIEDSDGNYVFVGQTNKGTSNTYDNYIVKINKDGQIVWEQNFGGNSFDELKSIRETDDHAYIVTGTTRSFGNNIGGILLAKIDFTGKIEWMKTFNREYLQAARSVVQTNDRGYVLTGYYTVAPLDSLCAYVIKTDENGNKIWGNAFGWTLDRHEANEIIQTNSGEYILIGTSGSANNGKEIYVVKMNKNGGYLWERFYGFSRDDEGYSIQETVDNGFVLCGSVTNVINNNKEAVLIKIDSIGNKQWMKTYGGERDDQAFSVKIEADGGYVLSGYTESFSKTRRKGWLIRTDLLGNELWRIVLGENNINEFRSVTTLKNGGFIVTGLSSTITFDTTSVLVVKFELDKCNRFVVKK